MQPCMCRCTQFQRLVWDVLRVVFQVYSVMAFVYGRLGLLITRKETLLDPKHPAKCHNCNIHTPLAYTEESMFTLTYSD